MGFDFRQQLVEDDEIDEVAASRYAEELSRRFAESPEGVALADRGIAPGHYLDLFLDYSLRYVGVSLAEMDGSDIRETLEVMAEKVTARPENLDRAIPEMEAFCDFVDRAFSFEKARAWKRAFRDYGPEFRRAIRDPRRWGMAKSMMMEGMARGYDLSTEEGVDEWLRTKQAEQIAAIEAGPGPDPRGRISLLDRIRGTLGLAGPGPGPGKPGTGPILVGDLTGDEFDSPGHGGSSKHSRKTEKSRRKQSKASRRQNRR